MWFNFVQGWTFYSHIWQFGGRTWWRLWFLAIKVIIVFEWWVAGNKESSPAFNSGGSTKTSLLCPPLFLLNLSITVLHDSFSKSFFFFFLNIIIINRFLCTIQMKQHSYPYFSGGHFHDHPAPRDVKRANLHIPSGRDECNLIAKFWRAGLCYAAANFNQSARKAFQWVPFQLTSFERLIMTKSHQQISAPYSF